MRTIFITLSLLLLVTACSEKQAATKLMVSDVQPISLTEGDFEISYDPNAIVLLKEKIRLTRYPDEVPGTSGKYGLAMTQLKSLLDYWQEGFDFNAHQQRINQWDHKIANINGYKLHYILNKSKKENAMPVVLLHGWPSTFLQMAKLIPELTKRGFDVVTISLPGYGFSEVTNKEGIAVHVMADVMHQLMTKNLGYEQFIVRASDIGAGVAKEWALTYPDQVKGLHLSGSSPYIFYVPQDLSQAEQTFVKNAQAFMQKNGAYASLHSTEPQTLAYALNDSPAGLAAWILKRYQTWTDHGGKLEDVYSKEDLLDILTIYWMTGTINSSMRSYFESATVYSPNFSKPVTVPAAFLMFKKDIAAGPREWEARTFGNIVQWNEEKSGGHFGDWEYPKKVAEDMEIFIKYLNNQ